MGSLVVSPSHASGGAPRRSVPGRWRSFPWLAALVLVVLRLPFLATPAGADEAGFLLVARQWHQGGSSLYGSYWVDRPPLLLWVFQLSDAWGGLPALRLLGCLAAAATVLTVASTVRRVGGDRPARWSAAAAAGLLLSPAFGALGVNGELLAAPFVATGMLCAVVVCGRPAGRRTWWAAALVGASVVAATMIKQNMVDAAVFTVVTWAVAWRSGRLPGRDLARAVAASAAGATAALVAVGTWTALHGTSLLGVLYAMYPFRVQAARVIASSQSHAAEGRLLLLVTQFALSGAPVVLAAFAWLALRRRERSPVVWGLTATWLFSLASVLMGGSYWLHYLVETVPATALAAGVVAGARPRWARAVVCTVVLAATAAWAVGGTMRWPETGSAVGHVLAGSAHRRDTVVSAFGDADLVLASGLPSPYPYLWALPARTLDPHLEVLRSTLAGASAPTWFVVRGRATLQRLRLGHVDAVLSRRYRPVGEVCGRTVYLLRLTTRPRLGSPRSCTAEPVFSTLRQDAVDDVRAAQR